MTIGEAQHLLAYLKYPPGDFDGLDGKNTQAAIRAFQRAENLTQDGSVGPETAAQLLDAVYHGRFKSDESPAAIVPKTGTFWDDIKYFTKSEPYIACSCGKCGGWPAEPSEKLMRLADSIREQAGVAMVPTSTVRCDEHNAAVGGVRDSRHRLGKAMDFYLCGWTSTETLALVKRQAGVRYTYAIPKSNCVHMDVE